MYRCFSQEALSARYSLGLLLVLDLVNDQPGKVIHTYKHADKDGEEHTRVEPINLKPAISRCGERGSISYRAERSDGISTIE